MPSIFEMMLDPASLVSAGASAHVHEVWRRRGAASQAKR